jgi:hypothetical protein
MLAATAVRERATMVRATMTSISVNPLDLVIITELDLTENIAAHDQLLIGLRAAQADFVRSRLAAVDSPLAKMNKCGT